MTPQGGPHSSTPSMAGYPPNHQSPLGMSPGGRGWDLQNGFGGPGMAPQGYGNMQMPGSAGGYGRGNQNPSPAGWGQQGTGNYQNNPGNNGYGGYQG